MALSRLNDVSSQHGPFFRSPFSWTFRVRVRHRWRWLAIWMKCSNRSLDGVEDWLIISSGRRKKKLASHQRRNQYPPLPAAGSFPRGWWTMMSRHDPKHPEQTVSTAKHFEPVARVCALSIRLIRTNQIIWMFSQNDAILELRRRLKQTIPFD